MLKRPTIYIPALTVLLAVVMLLFAARPAQNASAYDFDRLAALPVSADGRVKPLDTAARVSLMILSGRQTLRMQIPAEDGDTRTVTYSAVQWLADLVTDPDKAAEYPVFRVDHPDVLQLMGLTLEEGGRHRLSFAQIMEHREVLLQQAQQVSQIKPKDRNAYQKHLWELYGHLNLYMELSHLSRPYIVAPLRDGEAWQPFEVAFAQFQQTGEASPAATHVASILRAYQEQNPQTFNQHLATYDALVRQGLPAETQRASFEVFFNRFAPFYQATTLYVVAFLLVCGSFLQRGFGGEGRGIALGRAAVALLILTFVLHTGALAARMWLQGRPPVTNLYSSAVFIGWAAVLCAILIEWHYRLGIGSLVAAVTGFVTLIIAHNLGSDGDTMEMMQAVLDTNFWLATHVVTVTIGYSATFLAGLLGIIYIIAGLLTPALRGDTHKKLGQMIYGTICFALLMSFVGTVLGGIWADQSWGRFWGWDPKENGAVLIVLMNALILHARWGGMVKQRGIAVLAVGGNIITAWSWFGTNMLGVGLHSYGFMDSAMFWLVAFVVSQLAIMALGLAPLSWWSSFRPQREPQALIPAPAGA